MNVWVLGCCRGWGGLGRCDDMMVIQKTQGGEKRKARKWGEEKRERFYVTPGPVFVSQL